MAKWKALSEVEKASTVAEDLPRRHLLEAEHQIQPLCLGAPLKGFGG